MDFLAEIIRTSQRKLASNDNQYEIVFRTDNPLILDLGKLPSDKIYKVGVTLHNNTDKKASEKDVENGGI